MKHKVAVKYPGKPLEIVEIESQYRTDVKSLITQDNDTILQFVIMKQTGDRVFCFACDEEGLYKDLPLNFEMLTQSGNTSFLSRVVGTVVFLVYELEDVYNQEIYDFEIRDITDKDVELAEHLLKEETQQQARYLAEVDPHIHDKQEFVFRPIENLEEFLGGISSSLRQIPMYMIPFAIFDHIQPGTEIEFFLDPAGKHKWAAGVKKPAYSSGEIEFYCKDIIAAKDFTINHYLFRDGEITRKIGEKYFRRFLVAMHSMQLPAFVYVSADTFEKYFS